MPATTARTEEAARWVKVAWGSDTRESYQTSLELVSKDRDGLVLDISAMLSTAKVRVLTFSSRGMPDGFAITSIVLEVTGSEQLELLMKKAQRHPGRYGRQAAYGLRAAPGRSSYCRRSAGRTGGSASAVGRKSAAICRKSSGRASSIPR